MNKAFVFGKFLPFHNGHAAMIDFALTRCDFLTVVVCGSDCENIPSVLRKQWIDEHFGNNPKLEVRVFNYSENDFPNTSVSSEEVSRIWSMQFKSLLPDYQTVITSEEYGSYVARYMGIEHILFDKERKAQPISATALRSDFTTHWHYLPDSVKPYYALKVVILGTESTGKTTLTNRLAAHFGCSKVSEAGRDLIANSNSFDMDDLQLTAIEHAKRINQAVRGSSALIIIDTDIHITMSYARFMLKRELIIEPEIYNQNKAQLYLYLDSTIDYVQDGTRLDEEQRNLLDYSHRQVLAENKITAVEIGGSRDERFRKAVELIEQHIKKQNLIQVK